jgi:hypothetical protein
MSGRAPRGPGHPEIPALRRSGPDIGQLTDVPIWPPGLGCLGVDELLAELAGYFRRQSEVPGPELVRLTAAAREGGSRWDAIAAGCGVRDYHDITGVTGLPCWKGDDTGAELLFCATQYAVEQVTGVQRRWPPPTWVCPGCGQLVTDRAPDGRPIHVEHGHSPGCARLAGADHRRLPALWLARVLPPLPRDRRRRLGRGGL